MRIDIVTLFPEMFEPFAHLGMVGRAVERGLLVLRYRSPRQFGIGKYRAVDDTPYGGGAGMVMRVDCLVACLESLDADAPTAATDPVPVAGHRVLVTPQGRPFVQADAQRLAQRPALALVCGRYEGVDERVRSFVDEEISLGDFVLSGGELAAMALVDACARLLAGVLGNPDSLREESHSPATGGLLEYPHFTRPAIFRDRSVPDVLHSGNHARIASWRAAQARSRTAERRPDILARDAGGGPEEAASVAGDPTPGGERREP